MINKNKYSSVILKRIKNFYNNDKKYELPTEIDINSEEETNTIDILKDNINSNYRISNISKAKIIYNYYKLYNEFVIRKKNNLKFIEFIKYKPIENRYIEKVKICYTFINNLLNIIKDMPSSFEDSKEVVLINILSECRITINKLYRLRGKEYEDLIAFLSPIYTEELEKDYKFMEKNFK
jgi:hypothetical protein